MCPSADARTPAEDTTSGPRIAAPKAPGDARGGNGAPQKPPPSHPPRADRRNGARQTKRSGSGADAERTKPGAKGSDAPQTRGSHKLGNGRRSSGVGRTNEPAKRQGRPLWQGYGPGGSGPVSFCKSAVLRKEALCLCREERKPARERDHLRPERPTYSGKGGAFFTQNSIQLLRIDTGPHPAHSPTRAARRFSHDPRAGPSRGFVAPATCRRSDGSPAWPRSTSPAATERPGRRSDHHRRYGVRPVEPSTSGRHTEANNDPGGVIPPRFQHTVAKSMTNDYNTITNPR